jgi:hypothetical protein
MRDTVKLGAKDQTPNMERAIKRLKSAVTNVFIPADENIKDENYQYVEVGLNGTMYMVARGRSVEVPVPVYEVLKLSGRFPLSA